MDDQTPEKPVASRAFWAKLVGPSGRVENTISLMVQTETEAVEKAGLLASLYDVELWCGGRLVAAFRSRKR